jgi:hypothetical protein
MPASRGQIREVASAILERWKTWSIGFVGLRAPSARVAFVRAARRGRRPQLLPASHGNDGVANRACKITRNDRAFVVRQAQGAEARLRQIQPLGRSIPVAM